MLKICNILLLLTIFLIQKAESTKKIPDITLHEQQTRNCITPQKIFSEISNEFFLQPSSNIHIINDLFQQPRSVLLFAVNDAISSFDCNDGSSLTRLTNLVTGKTTKEHGIFGDFWMNTNGKKEKAYENLENWSQVENLATLFEKKFKNGLSVAVSIDETFAKASSVKDSFNKNNVMVYFKENTFSHKYFGGKKEVLEFLKKSSLKGLTCTDLSCKLDNVEFHLKDQESFMFFSEVYMFFRAIEYGRENNNGVDPDIYTFASNSLKGILEKYGVESQNYSVASKFLVNVVIPQVVENAKQVYENRVLSKIYALGRSDRYKKKVFDVLKGLVDTTGMEDYFPNIYLPASDLSNEKKSTICNSLKSIDEQLTVNCDTNEHFSIGRTVLAVGGILQTINSTTNSTVDHETSLEIYEHQLSIWVAVILIFSLIGMLVATTNIDYSQDFLLYAFDEKVKKVK